MSFQPDTSHSLRMQGNQNAAKPFRLVSDMLRKIALQEPEKLRKACRKLYAKAAAGDVQAFRELADRVEGKVQSQDAQNQIKIIIAKDLSMFTAIVQPESSQEVLEGQSVNVSDETA